MEKVFIRANTVAAAPFVPAVTGPLIRALLFSPLLFAAMMMLAGCGSGGSGAGGTGRPSVKDAESSGLESGRFIADDLVLFWPAPVRAHPGVPLRFRFSAYDATNQGLAWLLDEGPEGMVLGPDGTLAWDPPPSASGTFTVGLHIERADGATRERRFELTVSPENFLFVSPGGSDSNPGTMSRPFRTIAAAMYAVPPARGTTILVRGGVYRESYHWEANEIYSPFRGKFFTADDPLIIAGYPGEAVILDCSFQGHGFWFYRTSFAVLSDVTVVNAGADERGGIMVSEATDILIRDTVVRGSRWSYTNNPTGYNIGGSGIILDHTAGFDNRDPSSDSWNSSDYLFYLDGAPGAPIYALASRAGESVTGFKVKHAGANRLVLHGALSVGNSYGYIVSSEGTSLRHSISLGNTTGIAIGTSDPNEFSVGGVLVDHNTVVNSRGTGLNIQEGYGIESANVITNNIFANLLAPAGQGEFDDRLLQLWIYDSEAESRPLVAEANLYFSPSTESIIRIGSARSLSFADWQSRGHDENGVFADPALAVTAGAADGSGAATLSVGAAVNLPSGTYAGATVPGAAAVIRRQ